MAHVRRRTFLRLLGGAVAWPAFAWGQQVPVVGYLHTQAAPAAAAATAAFRKGLADAGFADGRTSRL
jgi:putative ABC transport system substrate-binding protein